MFNPFRVVFSFFLAVSCAHGYMVEALQASVVSPERFPYGFSLQVLNGSGFFWQVRSA
jgi:hypothetical protein